MVFNQLYLRMGKWNWLYNLKVCSRRSDIPSKYPLLEGADHCPDIRKGLVQWLH